MRIKPTSMPDDGFFNNFIGYLSESSYGYPEVPTVAYGSDGEIRVYFNQFQTTFTTSPAALTHNVWKQVVVTFDGTIMSIYVDGQLMGSTSSLAGYPVDSFGDGQMLLSSMNDFAHLDELQVFDYTLSPTQVKRMFGAEWSLDTHLRFEEPPGASWFANDANYAANAFCNMAANQCPISSVAGRNGAAVQFQDTGRLLSVQKSTATPPLIHTTVAAWVKGSGTILARANDMDLVFSNTGVQIRTVNTSGSTMSRQRAHSTSPWHAPNPATWNHIAATFSGVAGGVL